MSKSDRRYLVVLVWTFIIAGYVWFPSTPAIQASGPANSLTVYEADNATQTNRPITFARNFVDGEISNCPQPKINGTAVSGTNWQADVKNRYADGSVKFAIISYIGSLSAAGSHVVTFQNSATCNNTGFISGTTNFDNFNGGNWDAQIKVTPAGLASFTTSAKSVLHVIDPGTETYGNCFNNYWLQGPVVTAVIAQDCTSLMSWDFGWAWNGSTMSGSPFLNVDPHASFHPMFVLYFYPTINAVQAEMIIENDWTGKNQDQLADFAFSTEDSGGVLHTKWSRTGARVITGITATATNLNPPQIATAAISASGAGFSSSDVGMGVCVTQAGYTSPQCGTIQSITSSTAATMALPTNAGGWAGGSGLTAYMDLQSAETRVRKTFWSGTPPGHIRIDYNFPYLISTGALPSYDLVNASIDPHVGYYPTVGTVKCCDFGYDGWVLTDRGDIGGFNGLIPSYAAVIEGAPLQRSDLALLYNMGTCGVSNGACAVALQQEMGVSALGDESTHAGLDTGTVTNFDVPGGGGTWETLGHVPYHLRESRTTPSSGRNGNAGTTNCFYLSQLENKNATTSTVVTPANFAACLGGGDGNVADPTGPNNATGKAFSVHAHSDVGNGPTGNVGSALNPPYSWDTGEGQYHWLDYAYVPYLLTGSPYYLENEYQSGAFQAYYSTLSGQAINVLNTIYIYRWYAWAMQTFSRAAYIAPDGSAEQAYWTTMFNSSLEFVEGALGVTGTNLTPSSSQGSFATTGTITNYNVNAANRWDLGRYTGITGSTQGCNTTGTGSCPIVPSGLHQWTQGFCNNSVGGGPYGVKINNPTTGALAQVWMYWYIVVTLGEARDLGFTQAASVHNATEQFLEGMTLSPTGNPWYALASYVFPINSGSVSSCTTDPAASLPFYGRYGGSTGIYSGWSSAYGNPTTTTNANNFSSNPPAGGEASGNFPCLDHGYSLVARAAGTFLPTYGVSETDVDGTYTPTAAWSWLNTNVPYWGNGAAASLPVDCPGSQAANSGGSFSSYSIQIKWSLAPRTATSGITITVLSSNPGSGVLITNSPADNFSNTSVTTAGSLTFGSGTFVTLTAPSIAGGNAFSSWTGCTPSGGTSCTLTVTAPVTVTANYAGAHGIPVRRVFTTAPLAMPQERK